MATIFRELSDHPSYISEKKLSDCLGEVIKYHKFISVVLINFQLDVLIQGLKTGYISRVLYHFAAYTGQNNTADHTSLVS